MTSYPRSRGASRNKPRTLPSHCCHTLASTWLKPATWTLLASQATENAESSCAPLPCGSSNTAHDCKRRPRAKSKGLRNADFALRDPWSRLILHYLCSNKLGRRGGWPMFWEPHHLGQQAAKMSAPSTQRQMYLRKGGLMCDCLERNKVLYTELHHKKNK